MAKTASYTQRAIKNYRNKHDFLNLTVAKGTRARMSAAGLSNSDVVKILMTELERREADQGLGLPSPEDLLKARREFDAIYKEL